MAYSKAKLKRHGDRACPCFKPLLIGNISDNVLPTLTILYFKNFDKNVSELIQTLFYQNLQVHRDTKLNENIIQDLPPN